MGVKVTSTPSGKYKYFDGGSRILTKLKKSKKKKQIAEKLGIEKKWVKYL